MSDVLGLILARGGSKGILRKNLQEVGGIPLIVRAVREAKSSRLSRVCVYSDSEEIRELAKWAQAEVYDRPADVSGDTATSEAAVNRFLHDYDSAEGIVPVRWVMMIQCTTPFLRAEHINLALSAIEADKDLDSVISVTSMPHYLGYLTEDQHWVPFYPYRWRRQEHQDPVFYIENGGFYLAKRELWEKDRRMGTACAIVPMGWYESMEIDELSDLEVARRLADMLDSQRKKEN